MDMAEDLSYLRGRLDEACNGITRLEEQVKNLFLRYEESAAEEKAHATKCATMKIDVAMQENRIKLLEAAKEKSGGRVWEVVAIVIAAIVGAVSGRWGK